MGTKIVIEKLNNDKKTEKIDYFYNNAKGIGGFISLLNEALEKNNYDIKIFRIQEEK